MKTSEQMKKRRREKVFKGPMAPRAKMPGVNVTVLQNTLFGESYYPEYFHTFRKSAELMKIFKILVNKPHYWQDGISYVMDVRDKIDMIFGAKTRKILTYKACQDFYINAGEINDLEDNIPPELAIDDIRQVYKNDLVLMRIDKDLAYNPELKCDIQILSNGLFQDTDEDFRAIILDREDFIAIRHNLKIVDLDGLNDETEAFT